jgi:hypothetical protein
MKEENGMKSVQLDARNERLMGKRTSSPERDPKLNEIDKRGAAKHGLGRTADAYGELTGTVGREFDPERRHKLVLNRVAREAGRISDEVWAARVKEILGE